MLIAVCIYTLSSQPLLVILNCYGLIFYHDDYIEKIFFLLFMGYTDSHNLITLLNLPQNEHA